MESFIIKRPGIDQGGGSHFSHRRIGGNQKTSSWERIPLGIPLEDPLGGSTGEISLEDPLGGPPGTFRGARGHPPGDDQVRVVNGGSGGRGSDRCQVWFFPETRHN